MCNLSGASFSSAQATYARFQLAVKGLARRKLGSCCELNQVLVHRSWEQVRLVLKQVAQLLSNRTERLGRE
jgi:hypothetical protein